MPDPGSVPPPRRFLVTIGAGRYAHLPESAHLPDVGPDVQRITAMFEPFGYQRVLPGLAEYAPAEHVKRALSHWCRDTRLGPGDIVAVYYAGHGMVEDRHYLLCWDSDEENLAASALPTEDLVRILTNSGLRNLLLILDTCYAGAGSVDASRVALQHLSRRLTGDPTVTGMWFLSSARARDEAGDGTFVAALPGALESVARRTGQRQEYLDLHDLVGELNAQFRRAGTGQRAELASGLSTGVAPFLPHRSYRSDLPPEGTDFEMQRLAAKRDLTEHFGPRARGVDWESERGSYFNGRTEVLARLVTWLATPGGDGKGRVVTGKPGCGKSAVLSRIVALSDVDYRRGLDLSSVDERTVVPPGTVDVAVHARHKRLEELVTRIAAGLGLAVDGTGDLLREISRRARSGVRTVIVVDALDEAGSGTATDSGGRGEPRRIARELLRPLSEVHGVHLLVGSRGELVASLGSAMRAVNLDDAELLGGSDIAGYVVKMLMAVEEPEVSTPYRDHPELAAEVGAAIAERATGVFLVARMTARSLRLAAEPVDTSVPGWAGRLPSEIGEAFEDYMARFGLEEPRVRRLLAPLAFAEGQGLPRGLWAHLASAVSGLPCTEDDIEWLLDMAAAYIAEMAENERAVYRLYHQTLAEHLRQDSRRPVVQAQRRIVDGLIEMVPRSDPARLNWFDAHPYIRANLPTHAAAGGRLDDLVRDPGFLLATAQAALLSAMRSVHTDQGRHVRTAYEQVAHRIASGDLGQRAAYLQLSARRCDAPELADGIERLGLALPWATRWADWSRTGAHRRLLGHEAAVTSVALGELDGRPVAVSGDEAGSARLWDLSTLRQIGAPLVGETGGDNGITAVALVEVDDYSLALLGCEDGGVRICDLSTGRETRAPLRGHTNGVTSIAVGILDSGLVALTGSRDGTARLWDLHRWAELGPPITGQLSTVNAVALGELDGRPVALTGGQDRRVRIWDLTNREQLGEPLSGHTEAVTAIALGRLADRTVALTGSTDQTIQLWDLATRQQLGEPMPAHRYGVWSVALDTSGEATAISGGADGLVRLWDLNARQQRDQPLTGHTDWVRSVALGLAGGRPVALTGGDDRTVRVWDLGADQPHGGHVNDVTTICLDPTGQLPYLVTGSADGTARLWDLHSRLEVGTPLSGHNGEVSAVALGGGASGPVVVTGDEYGAVRLWEIDPVGRARLLRSAHTNRVTALSLTTLDGRRLLLSGGQDGTVRSWDLDSSAVAGPAFAGHYDNVDLLAAGTADGRPVVIAASRSGRVSIWDLRTREALVLRVGWHRYTRTVAVACLAERPIALRQLRSNILVRWDALRAEPTGAESVGHTGQVRDSATGWLAGEPVALTGSADGTARLWSLRTGAAIGPPLQGHDSTVSQVGLGAVDGRAVAATGDGRTIRLWDAATGVQLGEPIIGHHPNVTALVLIVHEGRPALAAADGAAVRIWDLATGALLAPQVAGNRFGMFTLCTSTNRSGRRVLLTGGADHAIRIWDMADRTEIGQLFDQTPEIFSNVRALAPIERDGRLMAVSGSNAVTPRVWDVESQTLVAELAGHTAYIRAVAVAECSGELFAASGSADSTARLWRLADYTPFGGPLAGHDGDVNAVAFVHLRGRPVLVTGDDEGALRCWDVFTQKAVPTPFTQHDLEITCLATGVLDGQELFCVGSKDGLVRIWCLPEESLIAELNLEAVVTAIVLAAGGWLCVGTGSGMVTFTLHR